MVMNASGSNFKGLTIMLRKTLFNFCSLFILLIFWNERKCQEWVYEWVRLRNDIIIFNVILSSQCPFL